jgi:putative PEP-CTERM system TPR-repeat lipoprotein
MIQKITLVTILVLIFATSKMSEAADNFYELALQSFQKQEYDASYIYLKNALQANPKNLPAKLLMGKLLTQKGYYDEAIKEFKQALEYKIDIELVLLPLGNVLLFNEQFQDVIELGQGYTLSKPTMFEWKMLSAAAYSSLGKKQEARNDYLSAVNLFPKNTRALNSLIYLDLAENKLEAAEAGIEQSLSLDKGDSRTWHLKGKILEARGQLEQAIEVYQHALTLSNDDPLIRRSLAYTLISANRMDEAKIVAESIIKQTPDDPFAMLLSSWILSKNQQGELATSILDKLSNQLTTVSDEQYSKQDSLYFVKGMTDFIQGNFEQARQSLTKYIAKNNEDLNALAMLAEIYVSMGQNEAAMHLLDRNEEKLYENLPIALKLAQLYLSNGKDFKADYLLTKLRELYPDSIQVILLSSKALVARDKTDLAIQLIENSSTAFPNNSTLLLARGFLYIQKGRFAEALKAAEVLVKADSRNVDHWNLQAAALLKLQRYDEAQTAIDNILAIAPQHFAGRFNLATLFKNTNRLTEAKTLFAALVKENPQNNASVFQLALIESQTNELSSAINRLENLTLLDTKNRQAYLLLLDLYNNNQQPDKALRLVNKLVKDFPVDPEFALKKAQLLIANNQFTEAKIQLGKLYNLWLDNPQKLYTVSSMQQQVEDYDGATNTLKRALGYLPQHLLLNLEYARLNLQLDEITKAQEIAESMQKYYGDQASISLLIGDIYLAKDQLPNAYANYSKATKLDPSYQMPLVRMYELARRNVKSTEFTVLLTELVDKQPQNNWTRKLLADHLMNLGLWQEAQNHYLTLIDDPNLNQDFSILNNLANIYMATDLTTALDYSKRALRSAGTNPAVQDTHGWILAKMGRFEDALVSLRQANAIDSTDPATRFHLAYTLAKLGRLSEAKLELETALASPSVFAERDDAKALLATM